MILRNVAKMLTWGGVGWLGASLVMVPLSLLLPREHPVARALDLPLFLVSWGWLLGMPLLCGAALWLDHPLGGEARTPFVKYGCGVLLLVWLVLFLLSLTMVRSPR